MSLKQRHGVYLFAVFVMCSSMSLILLIDPALTVLFFQILPINEINEIIPSRGAPLATYQKYAHSVLDAPLISVILLAVVALLIVRLDSRNSMEGWSTAIDLVDAKELKTARPKTLKFLVFFLAMLTLATFVNAASKVYVFSVPEHREILTYLERQSLSVGEDIKVYANSPASSFTLDLKRLGGSDEILYQSGSLPSVTQVTRNEAFENGAGWEVTHEIPSDNLPPGIYSVEASDGEKSFQSGFCLRDPSRKSQSTAVLLNTHTWAAYNNWGGASLYERLGWKGATLETNASQVSLLRPNPFAQPIPGSGHLLGAELNFTNWLAQNDVAFDCLTDSDLHHNKDILDDVELLILNTHPEYWSEDMRHHLDSFLQQGGSLLYLGGNGLWWKTTVLENSSIHVDKKEGKDLWSSSNQPPSQLLGVGYNIQSFGTYAPYEVLLPDHWLFAGLNLQKNDLFGFASLAAAEGVGASGWETDTKDGFSPPFGLVLAKGTNATGGGADLFYYEHSGGGTVLSFGSITSASSVPIDRGMEVIVTNYLQTFSK